MEEEFPVLSKAQQQSHRQKKRFVPMDLKKQSIRVESESSSSSSSSAPSRSAWQQLPSVVITPLTETFVKAPMKVLPRQPTEEEKRKALQQQKYQDLVSELKKVQAEIAELQTKVDTIKNSKSQEFDIHLQETFSHHLKRFPKHRRDSDKRDFSSTMDVRMFNKVLAEQLQGFQFAKKMVYHDDCGHAYFVRKHSDLEKRFDAKWNIWPAELRKFYSPFLVMGFAAPKGWVGVYWDLSKYPLEDIPKQKKESVVGYCYEDYDSSFSESQFEDSSSSEEVDDDDDDEQSNDSDPTKRELSGFVLEQKQWHCFKKLLKGSCGNVYPSPTSGYIHTLVNNATGIKRVDEDCLQMDSFGLHYGQNIPCIRGKDMEHRCVVCAILLSNKSNQIYQLFDEFYTQAGYRHLKIPFVGYLNTNNIYMDYWHFHADLSVNPPLTPAQPWSKDHIWRMLNLSLFCLHNSEKSPLRFDKWMDCFHSEDAAKLKEFNFQIQLLKTKEVAVFVKLQQTPNK